jgi:hypothetical protein
VDLVFSHAVLGHVRRSLYGETVAEMFRITKPGGISSHQIDLRDHLGGALNHLRFSAQTWEADWMARSGFYTNRFRLDEHVAAFQQAGWVSDISGLETWPSLPTPRRLLASPFKEMAEANLLVSHVALRAHKPCAGTACRPQRAGEDRPTPEMLT